MKHILHMEFDLEYGTHKPIPRYMGRLVLGPYIGRLALDPQTGAMKLVIDERAVTEGYVVVYKHVEQPLTGQREVIGFEDDP